MKVKFQISNFKFQISPGFTLVELLVVIAIIGILASIGLVAFTSAQARSRDAQRKSDLMQLSRALELFYSDYGQYPPDSGSGRIMACPFDSVHKTGVACSWGSAEFSDTDGSGNTKTIYFKILPKDPTGSGNYYYRVVSDSGNQKYQLFAYLENSQDQSIMSPPTSYSCGAGHSCNFSVTSANTTPVEQ